MADTPTNSLQLKQIVTMQLGVEGFAQHWKHCDLVANYLATFTIELLGKSESHGNLISTVINELLEVIFRRNSGIGDISIQLSGNDNALLVEFMVPTGDSERHFYEEMAALVKRADRDQLHWQQLAHSDTNEYDLSLSLLELAAVYDAVLEVDASSTGGTVLLRLPFHIEV